MSRLVKLLIIAVGIILLFFLPTVIKSEYTLHVINLSGIYAICVVGLIFLIGFTGQLSLGHSAFMGIGAYTSALLAVELGLPFIVTFPAAIVVTMIFGVILGIPTLKLKSHYLAMATMGLNTIVLLVFRNWKELTHGADGIVNIPSAGIGSFYIKSEQHWYYLILVILILSFFISRRIEVSRIGRSFKAIREGELTASVMGIDTYKMKILALVISAAFAGVAGSLFAHFNKFIAPTDFGTSQSLVMVSMAIIGGSSHLIGGILGAILLMLLPEYLRFLSTYTRLVHGLLIVVMIILAPSGIIGVLQKTLQKHNIYLFWDYKKAKEMASNSANSREA